MVVCEFQDEMFLVSFATGVGRNFHKTAKMYRCCLHAMYIVFMECSVSYQKTLLAFSGSVGYIAQEKSAKCSHGFNPLECKQAVESTGEFAR